MRMCIIILNICCMFIFIEAISYRMSSSNATIDSSSVFYMRGQLLVPELAIDGHSHTNQSECQCCASTTETLNPSYQLTLGSKQHYRLSKIIVLGRTDDPGGENLKGLTVWLGSRETDPVGVITGNDTSLSISLQDVQFEEIIILELVNRFDKFVLCEVIVYSSDIVSEGSVVTLSSLLQFPSGYYWAGHKAVHGDLATDLSPACQCCTSTSFQDNPWLQVDLGQQQAITIVEIICLNDGGDWLYAAEVFLAKHDQLTYFTPVHTLTGLSWVYHLNIQPIVMSRYVTLRRLGPELLLTVCEITVYAKGCSPDRWGVNCSRTCGNCVNNNPCRESDGYCQSCQPGYTGQRCDIDVLSFEKPVASNMTTTSLLVDGSNNTCVDYSQLMDPWVQVDLGKHFTISEVHLNGNITEATVSLYFSPYTEGLNETNPALTLPGVDPTGAADNLTGLSIVMLPVGPYTSTVTLVFTGNLTSLTICEIVITGNESCPAGYYGPNCCQPCLQTDCVDGTCHPTTGLCQCPRGYMGADCTQVCPEGLYGNGCNKKCGHCEGNLPCDPRNGSCSSCGTGYTGDLCQTGQSSQDCYCLESSTCTKQGVCPQGGCAPGWVGPSCSEECPEGFYGLDCSESCSDWNIVIIYAIGGAAVGVIATGFTFNIVMCITCTIHCIRNFKWKPRKRRKHKKTKKVREDKRRISERKHISESSSSSSKTSSGSYTGSSSSAASSSTASSSTASSSSSTATSDSERLRAITLKSEKRHQLDISRI